MNIYNSREKKVKKNKEYRFVGILVISLVALTLILFFIMYRTKGGSFSFGQKEKFFLNGIMDKTADEITSVLGTPDYVSEFGSYGYQDFSLAGLKGNLMIDFHGQRVEDAYWTLENIDVDDYWPQINRIAAYFNKHYKQTDTWDWRKDKNNAYIVGIDTGYYIRVLFQ